MERHGTTNHTAIDGRETNTADFRRVSRSWGTTCPTINYRTHYNTHQNTVSSQNLSNTAPWILSKAFLHKMKQPIATLILSSAVLHEFQGILGSQQHQIQHWWPPWPQASWHPARKRRELLRAQRHMPRARGRDARIPGLIPLDVVAIGLDIEKTLIRHSKYSESKFLGKFNQKNHLTSSD